MNEVHLTEMGIFMENFFQSDEKSVKTSRIIYTPSFFAKTNLIHLQETGKLHALKPHTSQRKNLSSYLFFIVLSGKGSLSRNNKTYHLNAGDCVFIDCQKPYAHHTSEQQDELWDLKWVHFYGANMDSIYQKYRERGGQPVFHPDDSSPYTDILDALYSIAGSGDYIRDMKIYEKLTSLLTKIMEQSWHPENRKNSTVHCNMQDIKNFIEENFQEKLSLETLSEHFYINKYYLTRLFKKAYGTTINHFIIQTKIAHAKYFLRFSNDSIESIAEKCGIGDANYFSRTFKKWEGISPREYRKSW